MPKIASFPPSPTEDVIINSWGKYVSKNRFLQAFIHLKEYKWMNSVVGTFFTPLLNRWIERQTRSCRGRGAITFPAFPANVSPRTTFGSKPFFHSPPPFIFVFTLWAGTHTLGFSAFFGVVCFLKAKLHKPSQSFIHAISIKQVLCNFSYKCKLFPRSV